MPRNDAGPGSATRAFAVAAIALAGLAFYLTPFSTRVDNAQLDALWRVLERLGTRGDADDIVVVGIDEASVRAIPEPPALWHMAFGNALARVAAAGPRAIAFDFPLPERSYDGIRPGLDRALFDGLATAVESVPLVAALNIDPHTRGARLIHKPYLALLGESRLGLSLIARDDDGVARRFSLVVPTEDGGFPTLEGRLCRVLKADCSEGLINYGLGRPFTYVPFRNLLEMKDDDLMRRLLRNRIVLIGEAQAYGGRIDVPVNPASWETHTGNTPGVALRAQTLRTALARAAPREAPAPLQGVLITLAALVYLMRDWRMAAVTSAVVAAVALAASVATLQAGLYVPLGSFLATLLVALAARLWVSRREPRAP